MTLQRLFFTVVAAVFLSSCDSKNDRIRELDDTYPYVEGQTYSNQLKACASAAEAYDSCTLERLPILGLETDSPTIEDVMSRVLVSNEWMGERFEILLNNLPEDFLLMFRGITVVVIDNEIRPSFYYNLTGAIYLDPASLWMLADEKGVISRQPDHRAGYSDPMSFRSFWRYTKDGAEAYEWFSLNSNRDRPLKDMLLPMASLLAHELAHANDLFPMSIYEQVDVSKTVFEVSEEFYSQYPSTLLKDSYPLQSNEMKHLAEILFLGRTPSQNDKDTSASQVGEYFSTDAANDDYAYSSQYEYAAMLVEEAVMKFYFDIDREMAFVDYVENATSWNDLKIAWGQRNRIADEYVKERAQFVMDKIFPGIDYSEKFDALGEVTDFPYGIGWEEALSYNPSQEKSSATQTKPQVQGRYTTPFNLEVMTRPYATHNHR